MPPLDLVSALFTGPGNGFFKITTGQLPIPEVPSSGVLEFKTNINSRFVEKAVEADGSVPAHACGW